MDIQQAEEDSGGDEEEYGGTCLSGYAFSLYGRGQVRRHQREEISQRSIYETSSSPSVWRCLW